MRLNLNNRPGQRSRAPASPQAWFCCEPGPRPLPPLNLPHPPPPLPRGRICNREIISKVQQVICFAFHDSNLLLETCREAKDSKKIVTLFYLD